MTPTNCGFFDEKDQRLGSWRAYLSSLFQRQYFASAIASIYVTGVTLYYSVFSSYDRYCKKRSTDQYRRPAHKIVAISAAPSRKQRTQESYEQASCWVSPRLLKAGT